MSTFVLSEEAFQLEVISPPSCDFLDLFLAQVAYLTAEQAERLLRRSFRCEQMQWRALRSIQEDAVRVPLATRIFGGKLAKDLGLVSTQDNPKTDYGEPRFCGSWDLDEK